MMAVSIMVLGRIPLGCPFFCVVVHTPQCGAINDTGPKLSVCLGDVPRALPFQILPFTLRSADLSDFASTYKSSVMSNMHGGSGADGEGISGPSEIPLYSPPRS